MNNEYYVPANEVHKYHVLLELKQFNPVTGKKISQPFVQKIGMKTFALIYSTLKRQNYDITILHDPVEYMKRKAELDVRDKSIEQKEEEKKEEEKKEEDVNTEEANKKSSKKKEK